MVAFRKTAGLFVVAVAVLFGVANAAKAAQVTVESNGSKVSVGSATHMEVFVEMMVKGKPTRVRFVCASREIYDSFGRVSGQNRRLVFTHDGGKINGLVF